MQTGELVHFYAVTIFNCSRLSISDFWVIFCSVKLKMQLEGSRSTIIKAATGAKLYKILNI